MTKRVPPICADCRWYSDFCFHPEVQTFDLVHGPLDVLPSVARGATGICGPDGNMWEQKTRRFRFMLEHGPMIAIVLFLTALFFMR